MVKQKPKITVVTVTFNLIKAGRKDCFIKCVESVHNQVYANIEHIIVDGGSTDGTLDLLKEYKSKGYISYISEKDNGIWNAMNKGIDLATGKYITFLNSDDLYCCDDAISSSVEILEKEKGDILSGYANCIDLETGKKCGENHLNWDCLPTGQFPCHQTVIYNTQILREIGKYNEKYIAADNISFAEFILRGKKACVNEKYVVDFAAGGFSWDKDVHSRVLKEWVDYFYDRVGKNIGLTKQECQSLQDYNFFALDTQQQVKLGLKLKNEIWMDMYFSAIIKNILNNNKKDVQLVQVDNKKKSFIKEHRLFSVIPFIKIKYKYNVLRVLLFNFLPIIRKKQQKDKMSLYLFSVIPLISISDKRIKLFGVPVLLRKVIKNHKYYQVTVGKYNFGTTLPFESEGLNAPEPWGVWSEGSKTSFYFRPDGKYVAEFDVMPFLVEGKEKQVVKLYVNDVEQGVYIFQSGKSFPKIVVSLPMSKKVHIMFKYEDVKSPAELGLSDDNRKIAMGFKSMEINKQK